MGVTLRKAVRAGLYPLVELFPSVVCEKLKLILNILGGKWRFCRGDNASRFFAAQTRADLERIFIGMNCASIDMADQFCRTRGIYPPNGIAEQYFLVNLDVWEDCPITPELAEQKKRDETMLANTDFQAAAQDKLLPESLVYHHGLRDFPESVRQYCAGKVFVDVGACSGDSTWAMLKYAPSIVWAFEPSAKNCRRFLAAMKRNQIPEAKYLLVPCALSWQKGVMQIDDDGSVGTSLDCGGDSRVEVTTLDDFASTHEGRIGMIKADTEGYGVAFLQGALDAIRRDRPVLSLAIYHSEEEFVQTYAILRETLTDYHFELQWHRPGTFWELMLIGYPNAKS
ncbi:MAG: FkbM family methyltransferase [Victivallaceae bacterium]|nr:FkbM family methyltransferase [Victivallaceae bacterium]